MSCDVLVVGGGPAGRALAAQTGRRGLRTVLVDARPAAPWRQRYGSWAATLPDWLPGHVIASSASGHAIALTEHRLGWNYAMLDVPALRDHLDAQLAQAAVEVRAGRVLGSGGPGAVALADGTTLRARVVVDAAGSAQPLAPARPGPLPAEQAAFGLVVDEAAAAPLIGPGEALFMDWRPDHGEAGPPTFLYAVPLGGGAVLLEETSLARRPGLGLPLLRRRLLARLARHGVAPDHAAAQDRVLLRMDTPRHPGLGFGAATPLLHPSTGFALADALSLAPAVAEVIATALPQGTGAALAEVRRLLWPPQAGAVHRLRRIGLEALLRMPPARVPEFFEAFFTLPERHRWSFLTGRTDLTGTLAAMNALFAGTGWPMRAMLVTPALRPPAPASLTLDR